MINGLYRLIHLKQIFLSLQKEKKIDENNIFLYNAEVLDIVDVFSYLGIKFNYNGKFRKTKKQLLDQSGKAMFSLVKKKKQENYFYFLIFNYIYLTV